MKMRMSELQLQEQAQHAANDYIKKNFPDFVSWPIDQRTTVYNTAFSLFFIGVRWLEGMINIEEVKLETEEGPKA